MHTLYQCICIYISQDLNDQLSRTNATRIKIVLLIEREALIHAVITQLARNLVKSGEIELAEV